MKLTDTQSLLFAHAAQCGSGSLYPLPTTLTSKAGAARSIVSLVRAGLVEERETSVAATVARQDGDLGFGMFLTTTGLAAIGVDDSAVEQVIVEVGAMAPPSPAPRTSKIAGVLALLGRDEGATLNELITATGWLPHTTCAVLTGLRKGHVLARSKRDGATCYRLVQA